MKKAMSRLAVSILLFVTVTFAACGQEGSAEHTKDFADGSGQQEVSFETGAETETEPETEPETEQEGLHIFSSDAEDESAQAVSVTVNDISFSSQSDALGILFSPDDGMPVPGVMFGGKAGNELVIILAEFADNDFMSDNSSYQQSDFGSDIAIEIIIMDLVAGESCNASTVYEEGADCYISDGTVSIAGHSDGGSVNASVSGTLHYNGTSYCFQASGNASHDAELLAELLNGNQGYGGAGSDHICSLCSGNGSCYRCGGSGTVYTIQGQQTCAGCDGSGVCSWCNGRGTY